MTNEEKAIEIAKKALKYEANDDSFDEVNAVHRGHGPVWDVHFTKKSEHQNSFTTVQVEVTE